MLETTNCQPKNKKSWRTLESQLI